jgi:hypothetical protein
MEKSWIEGWNMPELRAVYLNHTHDEGMFGGLEPDIERPLGAPDFSGETCYWDKKEQGWVLSERNLAAMKREMRVNVLCL